MHEGGFVSFALLWLTAEVAELVDALDLGSSGEIRGGSSPPFRMCARYVTTHLHRYSLWVATLDTPAQRHRELRELRLLNDDGPRHRCTVNHAVILVRPGAIENARVAPVILYCRRHAVVECHAVAGANVRPVIAGVA